MSLREAYARRLGSALTEDEVAALRLAAEGHMNAMAAHRLGISERAFKKRTASARARLGARTLHEAIWRATSFGLLPKAGSRMGGIPS